MTTNYTDVLAEQNLCKALNNGKNENIIGNTWESVQQLVDAAVSASIPSHLLTQKKIEIVKKLILSKLKNYVLADELCDLRPGTFIRWINKVSLNEEIERISHLRHLTPANINLNNVLARGATIYSVDIFENGITIVCKNMGQSGRYFSLKMEDCYIFHHLSNQEQLLLDAIAAVHNNF